MQGVLALMLGIERAESLMKNLNGSTGFLDTICSDKITIDIKSKFMTLLRILVIFCLIFKKSSYKLMN